jgi:GT2 family glycosyltransferase
MHSGSTSADAAAKPHTHGAGKRALEDAVRRRGWGAAVEDGAVRNSYRLVWKPRCDAKVSIIICSRTPELLRRCLRVLERRTAYSNRELVIVEHRTPENQVGMEKLLARLGCVRVRYEGAFHFAMMNNLGAQRASGEILVFLNDDTEPLESGWLGALVAQLERPGVGIAGARLLYRSGAIQHAGLAIGIVEGVGHLHRDTFGAEFWKWVPFARNVSAVTGACLGIRKRLFEELAGFDLAFPVNFNDADLCLRARQLGYEVIYEPAAVLRHYECSTRTPGILYEERERWNDRWGTVLERGDSYYSPNLTRTREDASLNMEKQPAAPSPPATAAARG